MVSKRSLAIAALLGVGVAALVLVFVLRSGNAELGGSKRPEGTGDAGFIWVYAQLAKGPVRLIPGRSRKLHRPQDIAFVWTVRGTGPRILRIELDDGGRRWLAHEEQLQAPGEQEPLEFVLVLSDAAPDKLTLITTMEAPHTASVVAKYPIELGAPFNP